MLSLKFPCVGPSVDWMHKLDASCLTYKLEQRSIDVATGQFDFKVDMLHKVFELSLKWCVTFNSFRLFLRPVLLFSLCFSERNRRGCKLVINPHISQGFTSWMSPRLVHAVLNEPPSLDLCVRQLAVSQKYQLVWQ